MSVSRFSTIIKEENKEQVTKDDSGSVDAGLRTKRNPSYRDDEVKPKLENMTESPPSQTPSRRSRFGLIIKDEEDKTLVKTDELKQDSAASNSTRSLRFQGGIIIKEEDGVKREALAQALSISHRAIVVEVPFKDTVFMQYRALRSHNPEVRVVAESQGRNTDPEIVTPQPDNLPFDASESRVPSLGTDPTGLIDRFSPSVPGGSPSLAYSTDEAAGMDLIVTGESLHDTPPEDHPVPMAEDSMIIDLTEDNDEQAMHVDPASRSSPGNSRGINLNHNPKIKGIKTEMAVSFDTFASRYVQLGGHELFAVTLDPELRDHTVPRLLISHLYGGSIQQTFPRPSDAFIAKHGVNDFMCLNYDMNPNAPMFVGAPGFFFNVGNTHAKDCTPWPGPHRLITRFEANKWQYLGQYATSASESLSVAEWFAQKEAFRRTWVREILKTKWGLSVRARIALRRRLGRPLSDTDYDNPPWPTKELGAETTAEQVLEAFASGEMFIRVWGLKCVGYDEGFQMSLINGTTWHRPLHAEVDTDANTLV